MTALKIALEGGEGIEDVEEGDQDHEGHDENARPLAPSSFRRLFDALVTFDAFDICF
jgi:hypothetical protein